MAVLVSGLLEDEFSHADDGMGNARCKAAIEAADAMCGDELCLAEWTEAFTNAMRQS